METRTAGRKEAFIPTEQTAPASAGAHTRARARERKAGMAASYESNLKILEEKLKAAGLYHTSLRPTLSECAKIMTRVHHYNRDVIANHYRTSTSDGKRPPELIALENASREYLNYLKALGLVADTKRPKADAEKQQGAPSPLAGLAELLAQAEADDPP